MSRRAPWAIVTVASLALLAACQSNDTADLQAFVQNAYKNSKPMVPPIPDMTPPPQFTYAAQLLPDPFSPANLTAGMVAKGIRPDLNRKKGPLEQYPLDALKMVGTLSHGRQTWAIIQTPDGGTHQIARGGHMGESYGTVTGITPDRVVVTELVPGPDGNYVAHKASVAIGK